MKKRDTVLVICLLMALFIAGCGNSNKGSFQMQEGSYYNPTEQSSEESISEKEEETVTELSSKDIYYMILQHDEQNQNMVLMNLTDGRQAQYEYSEGTEFFDKYF